MVCRGRKPVAQTYYLAERLHQPLDTLLGRYIPTLQVGIMCRNLKVGSDEVGIKVWGATLGMVQK